MKLEIQIERAVRKDMVENGFDPSGSIIADEQLHVFDAYVNGRFKKASYTASLYPVGIGLNRPALICWYGFVDEKKQYLYRS